MIQTLETIAADFHAEGRYFSEYFALYVGYVKAAEPCDTGYRRLARRLIELIADRPVPDRSRILGDGRRCDLAVSRAPAELTFSPAHGAFPCTR